MVVSMALDTGNDEKIRKRERAEQSWVESSPCQEVDPQSHQRLAGPQWGGEG